MVRTTIGFGGVLVLVGLIAYAVSAGASVTALIPAFLGAVILALGLVARASSGATPYAVVGAVVIALLAVFGSFRGVGAFLALLGGEDVERPVAAVAQALTLLLSVGYIAVIARQWSATRRGRG